MVCPLCHYQPVRSRLMQVTERGRTLTLPVYACPRCEWAEETNKVHTRAPHFIIVTDGQTETASSK